MAKSPKEYLDRAKAADASPEELSELATAEWEFVREAVARNRKTDPSVFASLVPADPQNVHESLITAIAERRDAPPDVLGRLARLVASRLRTDRPPVMLGAALAVCCNPATPLADVMAILGSEHARKRFRAMLATRCRRHDVLEHLAADASGTVSQRARSKLEAPAARGVTG